ncbi:hypothetical protein BT93_L5611 [Corymbia citriodora subsp. variegata]|uniref:NAD(P)-binding protein n=1 Tax=Corymbia citriodora subsp. variegata TaxID=360336 RepID=A0A8T0CJ66_CORYI|nr:hypothetical protein BT93_L5611 [Corymbia citriodora subsp. variegata]
MPDTESSRPIRSLKGRVAIVSGAGSQGSGIGNGRAAALLLAEAGCDVACVDMNAADAERTAEMINAEGHGQAIALSANVTSEQDCKRAVSEAVKRFGRLDILVNNVGIMGTPGTALEVDMAQWEDGMRMNISSMVIMAKSAIPEMRKNNGPETAFWRGSIVNVSSVAGLLGGAPSLLYPTSKGAVLNLTRAMASHHAKDKIRVNCICPGAVYTPMVNHQGGGMDEEMRKSRAEMSPLKTEGTGWDCGAAVRFLASDEAR